MTKFTSLMALAGAAVALTLPAAAQRAHDAKGTLTLVAENDSLSSGADRNYTSGVKASYVGPLDVFPKWLEHADNFTRPFTGARPSYWGVAVGQSIFTPQDISTPVAPADQHPYAGWLYVQLTLAAEQWNPPGDDPQFVDLFDLEVGMVGPAALGRQSQRGIHQALGAPEPKGWDSQLKDELAFAASLERRWRTDRKVPIMGLEADMSPSLGVTLGTLRTEARAGLSFRLGDNLDSDYGAPRVRPALSGIGHFRADRSFSWYAFAGVDARAVGRNLFLDGNTYRDSASVDRKPFVADLQAGLAVQAGDWRLVYTYVTRTEEFETQTEQQDFGVLALSTRF
jgi:hypothetical protein